MHSITYEQAYSDWNEALPLGNGVFGAMTYYDGEKLTFAMNHYEVYYKKLERYSNKYKLDASLNKLDFSKAYGYKYDELLKVADEGYRDPEKEPILSYSEFLGNLHKNYGRDIHGTSHYPTGELQIIPSHKLAEPDYFSLNLSIEEASVGFNIKKSIKCLNINTIVSRDSDLLISYIKQNEKGLLNFIKLYMPKRKGLEFEVEYKALDECTFYYIVSFYPDGEDQKQFKPFRFLVLTRIYGAKGEIGTYDGSFGFHIYEDSKEIRLITTVVTEEETAELLNTAVSRVNRAILNIHHVSEVHHKYWRQFWNKVAISIPDKMLEDLWYLHLYLLDCSSGSGGKMYQQACGLNGLWDIKQPTRWGSSWYWDVNIQASFWPVFTANQLKLAELFVDGLLSYSNEAEKMAEEFHGIKGIAMDFQFALYVCIWPWCAQFLWWYYRYSMNQVFLKEKAYPLFKKILKFVEGYIKFDKEKKEYYFYPEISPEQGPFTRNSTITLATVRHLLKISMEANLILGESVEDYTKWKELHAKLAYYPIAASSESGSRFKDSEYAHKDMHLRHPSLLMPIYPIGEIDQFSDKKERELAENTLRFAEDNTEIGVFQFGWLSCAASRLGNGDKAIRLLYEKGIDLLMRCNGLFSEETDRWVQFCNITAPDIYCPPMMEASGEMIASVNEMLLQSYNGIINVFPAVPEGKVEAEKLIGLYEHEVSEKIMKYDGWLDCSFKGLLSEGAFEISAERTSGETQWMKVKSLAGSIISIRNPWNNEKPIISLLENGTNKKVDFLLEKEIIRFSTEADREYLIQKPSENVSGEKYSAEENLSTAHIPSVKVHEAHTYRRIFLGKDRDTDFYKALDGFIFDYYEGNYRKSQVTIYKLDFGVASECLKKDYSKILPKQIHMEGQLGPNFRKLTTKSIFSGFNGLGWENPESIECINRQGPDELRRDFIQSDRKNTFCIELPKGKYDILFVTGDSEAASFTEVKINGQYGWIPEKPLKANEFTCEILPLIQKKDGYLRINLSTKKGFCWKLNFIIINKHYSFL